MNIKLLHAAFNGWERFTEKFGKGKIPELESLNEVAESTILHHYVATKEYALFDQSVSRLTKEYLYDQENLKTIYNCYIQRNLHLLAFDYITQAMRYMDEHEIEIEPPTQLMFDKAEDTRMYPELKQSLINIRSLQAKSIPLITPDIINDKKKLGEFILGEFIEASKVMRDKIQAVKTIPHENRFNDLLLAILRLRFQIWGWSIHDQARTGNSSTKKDAGESDITIQAGNTTFALVEALILKGGDKTYTQKHIKKMYEYVNYVNCYYSVVYYKGTASRFEASWKHYKKNVLSCIIPVPFTLNVPAGFTCHMENFDDVHNIWIAETRHMNNAKTYHIMINLAQ